MRVCRLILRAMKNTVIAGLFRRADCGIGVASRTHQLGHQACVLSDIDDCHQHDKLCVFAD